MSEGEATRGRVESLLALLGDGADEVVLVGGCAPAFYELAAFVGDIRPTLDVDLLVEGETYSAYQASVKRIAARANLAPDQTPGAPICRLRREELIVDVMPARGEFLGFTNCWYGEAWSSALVLRTTGGREVRVVSPLLFVATKLEAARAPERRGHGDFLMSPDIEDLVRVLAGCQGLLDEIRDDGGEIHEAVRAGLRGLLTQRGFVDAIPGYFEGDAATQAHVAPFVAELRRAVVP
jgi:hypothetical protein